MGILVAEICTHIDIVRIYRILDHLASHPEHLALPRPRHNALEPPQLQRAALGALIIVLANISVILLIHYSHLLLEFQLEFQLLLGV